MAAPGAVPLTLAALGSPAALVALAWLAWRLAPAPSEHAQGATTLALVVYAGLHALLGLVGSLFVLARLQAGFVSPARNLEPRNLALWQAYTAATGLLVLLLATGLPLAMAGSGAGAGG